MAQATRTLDTVTYRVEAQCAGLQSTNNYRSAVSPTTAAYDVAESFFRGAGSTVVAPGYLYQRPTGESVWQYTAYGPDRRRDVITIRIVSTD